MLFFILVFLFCFLPWPFLFAFEGISMPKCPEHEEWVKCAIPACQRVCGRPPVFCRAASINSDTDSTKDGQHQTNNETNVEGNNAFSSRFVCPPNAKGACVCQSGYIRSSFGDCCILQKDCDNGKDCCDGKCGDNTDCNDDKHHGCRKHERWYECEPCEQKCGKPEHACILICKEDTAGCYCKSGYWRARNGNCVHKNQCKSKNRCPKNERWYECEPCAQECEKPDVACAAICKEDTAGCYCTPGYLRAKNGKCVPKDQCDSKNRCPKNERWYECEPCELECDKPACAAICKTNKAGCYCNPGYLRAKNRKCVSKDQCGSNKDNDEVNE